jgi:hypothetical protein
MGSPRLAFSLRGFGGLELSTVPYAYSWVNSSLHWLLDQVLLSSCFKLIIFH